MFEAGTANTQTDATSQLATVAASCVAPACEDNLKGRLAATKHDHTPTWKTCMRVCAQSNITYQNAGFQWSPTHITKLQERSSRRLQNTSFLFFFFLLLYMEIELLLAI